VIVAVKGLCAGLSPETSAAAPTCCCVNDVTVPVAGDKLSQGTSAVPVSQWSPHTPSAGSTSRAAGEPRKGIDVTVAGDTCSTGPVASCRGWSSVD